MRSFIGNSASAPTIRAPGIVPEDISDAQPKSKNQMDLNYKIDGRHKKMRGDKSLGVDGAVLVLSAGVAWCLWTPNYSHKIVSSVNIRDTAKRKALGANNLGLERRSRF